MSEPENQIVDFSAVAAELQFTKNLTPAKDRVAVVQPREDEAISGGIYLPASRHKAYELGEVKALGAGAQDLGVSVGDLIVFQTTPSFKQGMTHQVADHLAVLIHGGDVIGRLTRGTTVAREAFEPVGRWLLVRYEMPETYRGLFLPDGSQLAASKSRFVLEAAGPKAGDDEAALKPGLEIYPDASRLTSIGFEGTTVKYAFMDPSFVHGWLAD